jgi:hypothetical protein
LKKTPNRDRGEIETLFLLTNLETNAQTDPDFKADSEIVASANSAHEIAADTYGYARAAHQGGA